MPHITAQCLSAETQHPGQGQAAGLGKQEKNRKNERLTSPTIQLDLRGLSGKALLAIPEASSVSNRSSLAQKLNVPPTATPTSTTSTIFDSPQKSSPSSSVSSANPLAIVQRAITPLAELEDTSLAYVCPELEDTSIRAIRSCASKNVPSYFMKSSHPTARSLVGAVDQQFSDYEAEIRFLRNSLAEVENSLREARKSLREAKKAADNSNHALDSAQEAIADRDYEIEIKKNLIARLEKDVKHCQRHHPPPTPPSKWRGPDGAISRFNVDTNRSPKSPESMNSVTTLSPSLIGRQFAASPKSSSDGSSTISAPKTPRSTFVGPSSGAPSPSVGSNAFPQFQKRSPDLRPSTYPPATAEALTTALSTAAGPPKSLAESIDGPIADVSPVRKSSLEQLIEATNKIGEPSSTQKSPNRSRRVIPSSASTPSLRDAHNMLPRSGAPALPPRLPMMSGGLGIIDGPVNETQEQKLRKKRGALGDLFRRKDQGPTTRDDMVRRKDQGSRVMDDMVNALDFCGI